MIRRISRPMLASMFLAGGYNQVKDPSGHVPGAQPFLDKLKPYVKGTPFEGVIADPQLAVRANGTAMLLGGAMLATGKLPRVGSTLIAATLIPTTLAGHEFWNEKDPQAKQMQMIQFLKNVSMLGGVLLAAEDTAGKPGLSYRAGMAADAASRVGHEIAREAKIATLQAQNKIA